MQMWQVLRDYQKQVIDDTRKAFMSSKKVILSLPTGAGKTLCTAYMISNAIQKNLRVAFIVDRLSLLDQTANVFDHMAIDFGIIQSNHVLTDYSKNFQICSAQTLLRRGYKDFDFVIIDEAHVLYRSQIEMLKNGNGTYFLGLTATPWTRGLGKYWEKLVTGPTTHELIQNGYLSKYIAYGPGKPDLSDVRISAGDYNKKDLARKTDTKKITGDIVEHWFKIANDRQTICMAVNVAHAEHIKDAFKKEGIKAGVVHCYQEEGVNQKILMDFRNGDLQVLTSVDMISRGFDMPVADCLIIARPTKSLNYHIQAIGRILRIAPGKNNALILDHAGNIERLGFPDEDFEMVLDKGDRNRPMMCPFCGWSGSAELGGKCPRCGLQIIAKRADREKLPTPCPRCKVLFKGSICPICGYERRKQHKVMTKDGMLVELQRDRHKATTAIDKEKIFSRLLAGARAVGFQDGWAKHQYRNYFGTWPARVNSVEPDHSFMKYLMSIDRPKALRIVWSIAKHEPHRIGDV